jgi:hypothetical protein
MSRMDRWFGGNCGTIIVGSWIIIGLYYYIQAHGGVLIIVW